MGMIIMNGKEYASSPKDGFPPIIYSDEEREIGVWRDGRPLYQKTITFTLSSGTNTVNLGVTNMGICSFICGFKVDDTNSTFIPFVDIEAGSSIDSWSAIVYRANLSSGDITYRAASRFAGQTVYATFQYTKTADTPGSGKYTTYGGLANHYSDTEQVIGTWVDGKPLYEKTIYCGDFTGSGNKEVAHNISNLGRVVKMFGAFNEGTTRFPLPIVMWGSAVTYQTRLAVTDTSIIISRDTAAQSVNIYVTLQYTKTTD